MVNTLAEVDELEAAIEEFSVDDAVELDSDEIEDDKASVLEETTGDELLIEDEIATEFDELTDEERGLLEPDLPPPPPPPPQATRLQPRIPIIIGFSKDVIIKLSRYCYSSLNHKSS